jgi:hypothetical protein
MTTAKKSSPRFLIVSRADGKRVPPMAWNDLVHSLKNGEDNTTVRALLELLTLRLGIARTHEDIDEMPAKRRHFHSGEAHSINEVAEWILLIGNNQAEELPEAVKAHFGWKPKTKSKAQPTEEDDE